VTKAARGYQVAGGQAGATESAGRS
jgi:hypothetical protein